MRPNFSAIQSTSKVLGTWNIVNGWVGGRVGENTADLANGFDYVDFCSVSVYLYIKAAYLYLKKHVRSAGVIFHTFHTLDNSTT